MKIDVVQFNSSLPPGIMEGKVAVVIDVFRATSVIVTALAHKAKEIIPISTINEALKLFNAFKAKNCILGGERNMVKIEGFQADNSPLSYMEDVQDKTVIFTTTNGTAAINFCKQAKKIFVASFLNANYVSEILLKQKNDIVILCAGRREKYSLEDACCAGKLVSYLSSCKEVEINDFEWTLKNIYEEHQANLIRFLSNGSAYSNLFRGGFEADLRFCLQENVYSCVPECKDGKITI